MDLIDAEEKTMGCGDNCLVKIVCGALAAGAGWLVTHALDGAAPHSPAVPLRLVAPAVRPAEPTRPPIVCDRWQECRKVPAGQCLRVSPSTVRCAWRRECRVVRRCH